MIETNLRKREHLAYSEKAWAYRVYMELHGKQGQRNDLDKTKGNGCTKLDTLSEIGKEMTIAAVRFPITSVLFI